MKNRRPLTGKESKTTRQTPIEPDTTTSNNMTSPATPRRRALGLHCGVHGAWKTCVEWHTHYAVWSSPFFRTNGHLTFSQRAQTSVWENDETEPKLSHPPLFSQIVTLPQISTYCLLSVFPETSLSQQRSTPIQISDAFSRGQDPSLMPAGPSSLLSPTGGVKGMNPAPHIHEHLRYTIMATALRTPSRITTSRLSTLR